MSRLHRDDVGTPIEDAGCAKRILVNLVRVRAAARAAAAAAAAPRSALTPPPPRTPARALQAVGVAAGALGAWGMLVFRRGGSTDPRRNPAVLFSGLLLDVAPLTAGGAALYTVTSCTLEANRGAKDWRNSVRGGCGGVRRERALAWLPPPPLSPPSAHRPRRRPAARWPARSCSASSSGRLPPRLSARSSLQLPRQDQICA